VSEAFLAGVVAGYGIAIPLGAIAVLIVEAGLRRGFRTGAAAGAGAATADGVYAAVAAISGSALAALLAPWSAFLRLLSIVVLVAIAARGLLSAWASRTSAGEGATAIDTRAGGGPLRTYLTFLGLTLLNPMTVTYFAALVLGLPEVGDAPPERAAFVAGAFLASVSWQLLLAAFGALLHGRASDRARRITAVVGNLVILGFAARIALDLSAG
jgi:arginine exporter protein ArgO